MLQILLPAWTVCLDLFFTAIAYGISGIRIPVRAACILSGTGAGCFLAAMELAKWSGLFLPASFCKLPIPFSIFLTKHSYLRSE